MRSALLLLLAFAAPALAQPTGERLPDLTPTSFEITGDVEVSLPQLERQPLSGFGPPPRTYVVPAERRAVTRPYGPPLDGLPALRLTPPPDPEALLVAGRTLRLEGGFGTEIARYGRLDAALSSRAATLYAQADYDGISPTVEVGAPPEETYVDYERAGGRVGVRTTGSVRLGAEVGGVWDRYSLPASLAVGERTISSAEAAGTAESDALNAVPGSLRLRVARTEAAYDRTAPSLVTSDPETRLEASGAVEFARRLVRLEGGVGSSRFIAVSNETDLIDFDGGLILQAHRPGGARFALGVRILGYTTSTLNGSAETTVVAPVAPIEVPLSAAVQFFAYTDPRLGRRDLLALFDANPYAMPTFLAPDVPLADGRAGVAVRSGAVGLTAWAAGQLMPTRLFFEQDAATRLYEPGYERARTVAAGADLTLATASGIEVSAGFAVRDGVLTEFDDALPFYAPFVGRAGLAVPFAQGRGRLGLSLYAEGERPVDRSGFGEAPAWATLRAEGSYEIGGGFGLVVRGDRLAGRAEQWPGYPQAPFVVMGGLRFVR